MFIVKKHQGPHGEVLVISDLEIIGHRYEEGQVQLDLSKEFYQGDKKTEEEVIQMVAKFYVLHLTGPRTVDLFVKLKMVEKDKILFVRGIPHAEVYIVEN